MQRLPQGADVAALAVQVALQIGQLALVPPLQIGQLALVCLQTKIIHVGALNIRIRFFEHIIVQLYQGTRWKSIGDHSGFYSDIILTIAFWCPVSILLFGCLLLPVYRHTTMVNGRLTLLCSRAEYRKRLTYMRAFRKQGTLA